MAIRRYLSPSPKIPWTPWDHMSYISQVKRAISLGNRRSMVISDVKEAISHGVLVWTHTIPCESHGMDTIPWDGLYFPWDVLIIFSCERQSHVKDLLSRVKYFPKGNIFPWERCPHGKYLPEEESHMWNIFSSAALPVLKPESTVSFVRPLSSPRVTQSVRGATLRVSKLIYHRNAWCGAFFPWEVIWIRLGERRALW